jgi:hypothetical protein
MMSGATTKIQKFTGSRRKWAFSGCATRSGGDGDLLMLESAPQQIPTLIKMAPPIAW